MQRRHGVVGVTNQSDLTAGIVHRMEPYQDTDWVTKSLRLDRPGTKPNCSVLKEWWNEMAPNDILIYSKISGFLCQRSFLLEQMGANRDPQAGNMQRVRDLRTLGPGESPSNPQEWKAGRIEDSKRSSTSNQHDLTNSQRWRRHAQRLYRSTPEGALELKEKRKNQTQFPPLIQKLSTSETLGKKN